MAEAIRITWLGHSCYQVEADGYSVVLDPYEDGYVPGCLPVDVEADLVLCSHGHGDHGASQVVKLREGGVCPFAVEVLDTYHDDQKGALRGRNKIHILDDGTFRLAHLGDLGCELTEEEIQKLSSLDLLMIPVGGFYTIDALQAKRLVDRIGPRVVIPMHYRGEGFGFDVLATVDAYTDQCDLVVEYPDNVLKLSRDTQEHTAVLQLRR